MPGENEPARRLAQLEACGAHGGARLTQALDLFDTSPAVRWIGCSAHGGARAYGLVHVWDGLLETLGWHGKRFDDPDAAHPLVFEDGRGLFCVNPALLPVGLAGRFPHLPTSALAARAKGALRLLRTSKPQARLRMMEYRGVVSAAMTYDALPIDDHFRAGRR